MARPEDAREQAASWRFARVDMDGRWGWRKVAAPMMDELLNELIALEAAPLRILRVRRLLKDIPSIHIHAEAQQRLAELELDDYDTLDELRLASDRWRAWGVVAGSVFYFLWWDPDHEIGRHGVPKGARRR